MRSLAFGLLALSAFASPLAAQDELPPAKTGLVRIVFLPPPMEGTLTLGLYNKAGKLVRTLHAEASADKDFTVGLNGLVTHWDGKDDAGNAAPAGKYSARGYCVGALEVEGVAYHCNEWMTDDASPRLRKIESIRLSPGDHLTADAILANGSAVGLTIDESGQAKVTAAPAETTPAPDSKTPPGGVPGPAGSHWVIAKGADDGPEVEQLAADGAIQRRLPVQPGDPPPLALAASTTRDFIAVLEGNAAVNRVRALVLGDSSPKGADDAAGHSTWKTLFSKSIDSSDDFAAAASHLGRSQPYVPEEKIRVHLLPNPLFKEAIHDLDLHLTVDAKGSILTTPDGLPLRRLTETPKLRWAVMARDAGSKTVSIFQSDGAVVEEFRAHRLVNMMAFDAGDYEWTGK